MKNKSVLILLSFYRKLILVVMLVIFWLFCIFALSSLLTYFEWIAIETGVIRFLEYLSSLLLVLLVISLRLDLPSPLLITRLGCM